ncbi:MAG TPA: transcription-repair coupling factor, partial [Saprospiraceae bacterium]|nr:transcription-repair coupling factor [Saprospiraceae bacterium]
MSVTNILKAYQQSEPIQKLIRLLADEQQQISIPNLSGSALSFLITAVFRQIDTPFLILFRDKEEAAYYLNDLEQLIGDKELLFFPGSYRRPYQIEEVDNINILLRTEVLNRINSRRKPAIIVSYPDALFEQVITKSELESNTLKIHTGDALSLN